MKMNVKLASLFMLVVMVFVPMQTAAAKGLADGRVLFGQSITVKSGETLNGDLVVFGGSATLEAGATVDGNAIVFGGNLVVDGEVTGDAAIVGGTMTLGASAHVHGNLSTVGASLERADGSQIDGQIYNAATAWGTNGITPKPPVVVTPSTPSLPNIHLNFPNPFLETFNAFAQSVGIALLAMLLMLFLAPHTQRVAKALVSQPLTAGGLGLLTVVVAPLAIVIFAVTIILIPAAILAAVGLVVVAVFGWIAVGLEIGQRFTKAIHQDWHPAFSAGLGTFVLTLIAKALTGIPVVSCIGWLVPFVLGLAAIGAVIMSRFGTQLVAAPIVTTPAVPPASPAGQNPAQ
jgi:cytoskeletal protein CcmA (bactofilin family)